MSAKNMLETTDRLIVLSKEGKPICNLMQTENLDLLRGMIERNWEERGKPLTHHIDDDGIHVLTCTV